MSIPVIIRLATLVVLLVLSAFASASEVALFSLTPNRIQSVEERQTRSARAILTLRSRQEQTLATVLILNNLVNICIVIMSGYIVDELFVFSSAGWAFGVKSIAVTFLILLCGEIIPKIFATHHSLRMALFAAIPLVTLSTLFNPLSWLLVAIGRGINRHTDHHDSLSIDELSDALEVATPQNREEREMLTEIVEFASTEVREIMHHRPDVVAIDVESGFDEVRRVITTSGYSRIPVYRESLDHIEGVLYIKDLIVFVGCGDDFEWQRHLRQAYFVPERKKINDLLEEFRTNRIHLAIVVDEYGSTLGVVSMEDVLEEIVGEIVDESDIERSFYTRLSENRYLFDGKTHLSDFIEVLHLADDAFGEYRERIETLAGLMLEMKGDFLRLNESLSSNGLTFTVRALDRHRIDKVEVVGGNGLY